MKTVKWTAGESNWVAPLYLTIHWPIGDKHVHVFIYMRYLFMNYFIQLTSEHFTPVIRDIHLYVENRTNHSPYIRLSICSITNTRAYILKTHSLCTLKYMYTTNKYPNFQQMFNVQHLVGVVFFVLITVFFSKPIANTEIVFVDLELAKCG